MVDIIKAKKAELEKVIAYHKMEVEKATVKLEVYDEVLAEMEKPGVADENCDNASCEPICENQNAI